MASPNTRARRSIQADYPTHVPVPPLAVVSAIQVTVQLGVLVGTTVQPQQPITFQIPTPDVLAQVPAEIEAKRQELQAQIDAQAGQSPPDVDGS